MASCEIVDVVDIVNYIWKISSVSSIPHVVGHVVQSPSFSLGGTSWTLKMYPNSDSRENNGFTSLTIERSKTRGVVDCYLYYKNFFNNGIRLKYIQLSESEKEKSIPRLMQNLKEISQDSEIVTNDTLYLIIELHGRHISSESVSPTISSTETISTTNGNESVVDEVFKEYERGKSFIFWVSDIPRRLKSDYVIQSPQFSFFNANWILKLRLYHRMGTSEKASFYIVLERLKSQVPMHHVRVLIHLFNPKGAKKEEYCTFDSGRIQSPAFEFQLKELDEPALGVRVEIRQFKSTRICLKFEKKSAEKSPVDENKTESFCSPSVSKMSLRNEALQDYKKLFFQKEHCDVTFKVQEKELHAHSVILDVRCPVLATAFRNEMKEKITGVTEIKDCDPGHFSDFLYFIYSGELDTLSTENVFTLFTLADTYGIQGLKSLCLDFIKRNLTSETFCETISLALLYCETDLINLSTEFFAKNMKEIILTAKWQSFILENPIRSNELLIKALSINNDGGR